MSYFSEETRFFGHQRPNELVARFGSPLYVYNEEILRKCCREIADLMTGVAFVGDYSMKANSNLALLKIVHEEGLYADAMSPGEIFLLLKAGFKPKEIFYVGNNVSEEEMKFAIDRGITVSADSLSQLAMIGRIAPGTKVAVRFNPGMGTGHHDKVVTAGKQTKFGVAPYAVDEVKRIAGEYQLKIIGVNQHIGSLFLEGTTYLQAARALLDIANNFTGLEFVDFGGGFGVPYRKQEAERRLDLRKLGEDLARMARIWQEQYGRKVTFKVEPGRYIPAECGILLGTVHTLKENYEKRYVGTDLGFNVLMRPVLYNAYHEIEVYHGGQVVKGGERQIVNVVGNICETGDVMADGRPLPPIAEGDILGVMDAGAYGYSMSTNYNCRLRPAEVLIRNNGEAELIRRRESFDDLLKGFVLPEEEDSADNPCFSQESVACKG
ncbi:MAG TPA: diaminopimelate decarboxylase [Bacillota bacterium]|nr:diaminopimelate decarboxylase [Bacillota bacterium]